MDTPPAIADSPDAVNLENAQGEIMFENVDFGYEKGKYILKNFNLTIKKGERVALVGHTGAGKSTIIHLLTRFYDVTKGDIKIDGIDINKISLYSLRRNVGVLMQDNFLFKGPIIDNIRYGRLDATDEECIEAARKVYASEFIERLPRGYYTELSERGEGLSAGERQLLSFARIVLKNPPIIILDEATSSIDTQTEKKIQQALEIMLSGRTSIIIAHRLSTIKNCDRILYIAGGGIAEEGTHQSLMEKKGLYYDLNIGETDDAN
jgi:ABC-type multidrug transport system fused ATPase/permease subunit